MLTCTAAHAMYDMTRRQYCYNRRLPDAHNFTRPHTCTIQTRKRCM